MTAYIAHYGELNRVRNVHTKPCRNFKMCAKKSKKSLKKLELRVTLPILSYYLVIIADILALVIKTEFYFCSGTLRFHCF